MDIVNYVTKQKHILPKKSKGTYFEMFNNYIFGCSGKLKINLIGLQPFFIISN